MFIVTGKNGYGREYVDCIAEQAGVPYVGANMRFKGYEPHHIDEWRLIHCDKTILLPEPRWFHTQFPWPVIW